MLKRCVVGLLSWALLSVAVAAVPDAPKTKPVAKKYRKAVAAPVIPVVPLVLAELSTEHMLIASKVQLGTVDCELGAKILVKPDSSPGRFVLELGRQVFHMEPTLTTTGAVRLEDPVNGAVWIQLGNKSMLLNTRLGKRLADACVSVQQAEVASAMQLTKTPGLLDDEPAAAPVPAPTSAAAR